MHGQDTAPAGDTASADRSTNAGSPAGSDAQPPYLTGPKLAAFVFAHALVCFLIALDTSIVATAIPSITSDFHSLGDIGWYGSAYLIVNCAFQPLAAKFFQYYKTKPTFLVFLALFEIGSLICGLAPSSKILIAGRVVAGIGGSGVVNGAIAMIMSAAAPEKRTLLIGIVMACGLMLGIAAGPLLGGAITQHATWRWCFYINLPPGAVVAGLILLINIPKSDVGKGDTPTWKSIHRRLDLIGFVLFGSTCTMLLLAIEYGGNTYPWKSPTVIGLFCGFAGALAIFVLWEWHVGPDAMVPLNLLKMRVIYSSCLLSIILLGGIQVFAYFLSVWLQTVFNASPTRSGIFFLATIVPQIVTTLVSSALVQKLGYYLPWAIAGNAIAAIGVGLITTFTPSTGIGKIVGYQIISGAGRGMVMQQSLTAVQAAVPAEQATIVSGMVIFSQFFGSGLFIALGQTIFTNSLRSSLAQYAPNVNPQSAIAAGATKIRQVVSSTELPGVLLAFNQSLVNVFFLCLATSLAGFIVSWGLGWVDIRKIHKPDPIKGEIDQEDDA